MSSCKFRKCLVALSFQIKQYKYCLINTAFLGLPCIFKLTHTRISSLHFATWVIQIGGHKKNQKILLGGPSYIYLVTAKTIHNVHPESVALCAWAVTLRHGSAWNGALYGETLQAGGPGLSSTEPPGAWKGIWMTWWFYRSSCVYLGEFRSGEPPKSRIRVGFGFRVSCFVDWNQLSLSVSGFGFRVSSLETNFRCRFRVSGFVDWNPLSLSVSGFGFCSSKPTINSRFRVSGFGFWSALGKLSLQSWFRVSGFEFRVSIGPGEGIVFRVGFGFPVSGFAVRNQL